MKKVINAWGTVTVLGGTTVSNDIIEAMGEAAKVYVDMKDLHKKAGDFIARLLDVEAACIVSGATAGLILSTAACLTRGNTERILALPGIDDDRRKILVQKLHRNPFVKSLGATGGEVSYFGDESKTSEKDLDSILDDKVAAVMYFVFDPQPGVLPLEKVVEISHKRKVPVIVDAAAELPPVSNLTNFVSTGADLVVFSGGKAIGAPNDTGFVIGRKDLIETIVRLEYYEIVAGQTVALLGRSMKVSKEDILALIAAIRDYKNRDHEAEMRVWEKKARYMVSELSKSKNLPPARLLCPKYPHGPRPLNIPRAAIDFNEAGRPGKAEEISNRLKAGDPPIYVYVQDNVLFLNPQCLQDEEEKTVVSRLLELAS